MIRFLKRFYFLFIIAALIFTWWISDYATKETLECGHLMVLSLLTEPMSPELYYIKSNEYDALLDRASESPGRVASEYRELFGWGWFPPKELRLLRDKFWIEVQLESLNK